MIVFVIIFCRNQDLFLTLLKSFSNHIKNRSPITAVTGQRRHTVVSNPASKLFAVRGRAEITKYVLTLSISFERSFS